MPPAAYRGARRLSNQSKPGELDQATRLVRRICRVAGDPRLIDKLSRDLATRGVRSAIRRHDTGVLFDWLLETISYQGIGNHVAHGYMQRHGRVRWNDIAALLKVRPSCPKLQSYWHFDHCGYQKVERCCAEPDHFAACPLPTHDLRNGRLNQAAYAWSCSCAMSPTAISSAGSTGASPMPTLLRRPIGQRGSDKLSSSRSPTLTASRTKCCRWRSPISCWQETRGASSGSKPARS